ncbi:hypothetical protein FCOIX_1538 [Fusarium coicis]|nr:hypothetical protein FCOIX_1538 [Fusarium coicis]
MTTPNPQSFNFPIRDSVYGPFPVGSPYPFDPLRALLSPQNRPKGSPQGMLSPVCLASFQNYDLALFLANREGHQEPASLLLEYHADPGRENAANGLHGAAWRGLDDNIKVYINTHKAKPDVTDGSSATPIIYAILGVQPEASAWKTIESLISYGASLLTRFGSKQLSYAEIALMAEKEYLARKFKELEASPSPTILNSSRGPSYTQEGSESDGGVSLSRESSCTVGRDDIDEQDPEVDGGAGLSRESSCIVRRYDDIQPHNKRPREDSEANGGAKRAREIVVRFARASKSLRVLGNNGAGKKTLIGSLIYKCGLELPQLEELERKEIQDCAEIVPFYEERGRAQSFYTPSELFIVEKNQAPDVAFWVVDASDSTNWELSVQNMTNSLSSGALQPRDKLIILVNKM